MGSDNAASTPGLTLSRMTQIDFSEVLRPRNRRGGDLTTAPIAPPCWPVAEGDEEEAVRRLEYSTLREFKFFRVDPTCHTSKVTAPNGEIASFAHWNFFPNGYDFEKHELVDVYEFSPTKVREVFKIDLYRELRTGMMKLREQWMRKGPCWGEVVTKIIRTSDPADSNFSADVNGHSPVL